MQHNVTIGNMTSIRKISQPLSIKELQKLIDAALKPCFESDEQENELFINVPAQCYRLHFYKKPWLDGYFTLLASTPDKKIFERNLPEKRSNWGAAVKDCAYVIATHMKSLDGQSMKVSLHDLNGDSPLRLMSETFPIDWTKQDPAETNHDAITAFSKAVAQELEESRKCSTYILSIQPMNQDAILYSKRDGSFQITYATKANKEFPKDQTQLCNHVIHLLTENIRKNI